MLRVKGSVDGGALLCEHYQRDVRRCYLLCYGYRPPLTHITFDLFFDLFDPFFPILGGAVERTACPVVYFFFLLLFSPIVGGRRTAY